MWNHDVILSTQFDNRRSLEFIPGRTYREAWSSVPQPWLEILVTACRDATMHQSLSIAKMLKILLEGVRHFHVLLILNLVGNGIGKFHPIDQLESCTPYSRSSLPSFQSK